MSTPSDQLFPQRTPQSFTDDYKAQTFVISQLINRIITIVNVRVTAVQNAGSTTSDPYVSVQPLLNMMAGNGTGTPHGIIDNVPVFRLRSGKFAIIADPVEGDVGSMLVAYRDSSSLVAQDLDNPGSLQGGSATYNPGSSAKYDWASGIYLGGILNGSITSFIRALSDGGITITGTSTVTINGVTIDTSGDLSAAQLSAGNGATGTFTAESGQTVTVTSGIITEIA